MEVGQNKFTELGVSQVIEVADAFVTELMRRTLLGDDPETVHLTDDVPQLTALRQQFILEIEELGLSDRLNKAEIAECVRSAFGALAKAAPPGSQLAGDIAFALDLAPPDGQAGLAVQQGSAAVIASLAFGLALLLAVAKLSGDVSNKGFDFHLDPGVPEHIEKVVSPFNALVGAAAEDIKKSLSKAGSTNEAPTGGVSTTDANK